MWAMQQLAEHFHGAAAMAMHGMQTAAVLAGVGRGGAGWFFYLKRPDIPAAIQRASAVAHAAGEQVLLRRVQRDWFFAGGARCSAASSGGGDRRHRRRAGQRHGASDRPDSPASCGIFQTGYIYHYAFAMIIGVLRCSTWFNAGERCEEIDHLIENT
jgi:NADH-quinone oxidoreductase subunit L